MSTGYRPWLSRGVHPPVSSLARRGVHFRHIYALQLQEHHDILYGDSGPVRFEEHIFCIRFPDITGYGDIDHERFEDYIFVGYHYIVPGSLVEYIFGIPSPTSLAPRCVHFRQSTGAP